MIKHFFKILIFFALVLAGCTDKFPTEELTDNNLNGGNISGDTLYIQTGKPWTGFNQPQDILIGREPFIYVADTDNDRIVMMNLDGQILGTRSIKKPIAIAQDYKLNLIICAQFDTTFNGITTTYSAVYKLDMFGSSHQIENASIKRILPRLSDLNQPQREYTGVAVFFNNRFLIARSGPNNSSIFDPDNSILVFDQKSASSGETIDTLIGRVPNIDPVSSGLVSANGISSLTSFNRQSFDFVVTLEGQNSFKTQWLEYVVTPISEGYESRFTSSDGVEFITPNKFKNPEGSAVDDAGNIYIADSVTDSIYKFSTFGDELESFGGPDVLNSPYAVAVFDRILYVADTGNNRILRFILSTDLR